MTTKFWMSVLLHLDIVICTLTELIV